MKLGVSIEIPDFTPWGKENFPRGWTTKTGIYVHGIPSTPDQTPIDPLSPDIWYIGVATGRLTTRMWKFYKTLEKGFDHNAGSTNHAGARKAKSLGYDSDDFSTAVCLIDSKEECHLAERILLYMYHQKYGRMPILNNH